MRQHLTKALWLAVCLLLVSVSVWAHHGPALSFDTDHMWTTWATVEEFHYINPHPAMKFARTDKNGNVEHWGAEAGEQSVAQLARAGLDKEPQPGGPKAGNPSEALSWHRADRRIHGLRAVG